MAGFERGRKLEKIGMHAQDTAELFFDDVRVPCGEPARRGGQGLPLPDAATAAGAALDRDLAARGAEAVLERTLAYSNERKAFGKPIGSFQNSRFVLAEMATEVDHRRGSSSTGVMALHLEEKLTTEEAAMAKWWSTELQVRVVDRCLQLHGGYGYMREYPIAKAYWIPACSRSTAAPPRS